MGVGDRVKKIIQRRGIVQEELGRKIGLDKSGMSKLLNNKRKVEEALLLKLTEALGVSSDYLLGREIKEGMTLEMLNEADQQFVNEFMKLDEEEKEKYKNIIKAIRGVKL